MFIYFLKHAFQVKIPGLCATEVGRNLENGHFRNTPFATLPGKSNFHRCNYDIIETPHKRQSDNLARNKTVQ